MAVALYGYFHVPAQDKPSALIVVVVSTAIWICYGLYEHQMQLWARTVIAPIRLDLEILAPLLYYSSFLLFRFTRGTTREPNGVTMEDEFTKKRNERDANKWRLIEAEFYMSKFREVHNRDAETTEELGQWVQNSGIRAEGSAISSWIDTNIEMLRAKGLFTDRR